MQTPRQYDPNEMITVTFPQITRSAAQWNQFMSFLDTGPHGMVRALIDAVLTAANSVPPPPANGPDPGSVVEVPVDDLPGRIGASHRRSKGANPADAG